MNVLNATNCILKEDQNVKSYLATILSQLKKQKTST
jgi:hypothetical protein